MSNLIVFEGQDEIIVADAGTVNEVIKDWFLEGQRSLEEYDTYLVDASEGFTITSRGLRMDDYTRKEFDVTELMPADLRQELIDADLMFE